MQKDNNIKLIINDANNTDIPIEISMSLSKYNTLLCIGRETTKSKDIKTILTSAIEHILENEILKHNR
jgi:hypothetical protein